jgi:protocatechuate 3,4-dioxygenase beta subunit
MTFLFAAFAILLAQQPQEAGKASIGKASIEGIVVQTVTGSPVEGVRVVLTKDTTPEAVVGGAVSSLSAFDNVRTSSSGSVGGMTINVTPAVPPVTPPISSDDKGKFAFSGLDPGVYRLTFAKNGYVQQEYGQRGLVGQGMPFHLSAGQDLKDVAIRLSPTGNISGRVFNEGGLPLANVTVELIRNSFNSAGQKILQTVSSTITNDRGEYRFSFITPGRYLLGAGTASSMPIELAVTLKWTSPNEFAEPFAHLFYPGVLDSKTATPIDVSMAADLGGLDFRLGRQQKFSVRGRVVDGEGKPPTNASLGIAFSVAGAAGGFNSGGNYKTDEGTFEFKDLVPGTYSIVEGTVFDRGVLSRERPGTAVEVTVINADLDGIVLSVPPVASISGRLTVDSLSTSATPELEKLKLRFAPPVGAPSYYAVNNFVAPSAASLDKDGAFKLDNVAPGEYRVVLIGLPPGYFVKEEHFGGTDVLTQPLRFDSSQTAKLEIVISPDSGQLTGIALNEKQQPASGVQAVLIPDRSRDRIELYKTAITDEAGRFLMAAIPPGDYKVFAWESIEPYSWFDPDVVRRSEPKARAVHVDELSKETIEVRTISAAP